MVKRCAYGICNSDTRYPGRLEGGVVFFPFPKPKTKPEKCRQWIKQCGRPHSQLNPTKITSCTYICSKHFVNGKPTAENPNPLAAAKVSNPKRKLGRNQKRLRCDCEEDECSDASSSSSLEKTPEDNQGSTVATDTDDSALLVSDRNKLQVEKALSSELGQCVESRLQVKMNSPEPEDISIKQEPEDHPHSTLRSSPPPPVKLYKHRVDGSDGSGASASSYGELRSDLAMRYKPIAPAPPRSNHTPPEPSSLQVKMSSPGPAATVSHQLFLIAVLLPKIQCGEIPGKDQTISIQQEPDRLDPNYNLPVEKRTDCDKCGKIFQTSGALQIHLRTHTGEKPFQCDECGIMIRNSNSLKVHLRIHTGEKPYHCGQCGKHFKSSSGLKSHMKSHSGKKPYQCHQCEKSFSTRGNLRTHLRIHSGEKPFLCNLCGEKFSSSTTLKSHQRGHAGKNRYHCGVCVKSFNTSSELKTHTVIHMGEKPYHCESKVQPTRSCQKAP